MRTSSRGYCLVMLTPVLNSIKVIEHLYRTGEEPVLVTCSDMNAYICKYMRSSATSYKLACEFIGAKMANLWQLETPDMAIVNIKQEHWAGRFVQHSISAPALGSKKMEYVVDITPSTIYDVKRSLNIFRQLLKIALFDFWIANEDRNANNANLLYDVRQEHLVSIDYGFIFNTATFEYAMSQLTSTDTILWSDLFKHLAKDVSPSLIDIVTRDLKKDFTEYLKRSAIQTKQLAASIPKEWKVPEDLIKEKLQQLFHKTWTDGVWDNFNECLKENLKNE